VPFVIFPYCDYLSAVHDVSNFDVDPTAVFLVELTGIIPVRKQLWRKELMKNRWFSIYLSLLLQIPASLLAQPLPNLLPNPGSITAQHFGVNESGGLNDPSTGQARLGLAQNSLTILPEDGRGLYFQALDAAKNEIRIEICVLEDPQILQHVQAALFRGVQIRAIVDRGKYSALTSEQENLALYLTSAGGQLHLSNPAFTRSFPKIILIDSNLVVYGSACLDTTTFLQYRDFATINTEAPILQELQRLFENDWMYSAAVGKEPPSFNPTTPISRKDLMISPVNSSDRMVRLYQAAQRTLDVYTELLGNLNLESELVAAVKRGVRVRLIAPVEVNGATTEMQQLQTDSLKALAAAGVAVHVSGPAESAQLPYMHARAAVVDGTFAYLGSISLSPDSSTFNREMGLISQQPFLVQALEAQFESDYHLRTKKF
jgi:cardiolipin synthase